MAITWRNIGRNVGGGGAVSGAFQGLNTAGRLIESAQGDLNRVGANVQKQDATNFDVITQRNDQDIQSKVRGIDNLSDWNAAVKGGVFDPRNVRETYGAQFNPQNLETTVQKHKQFLQNKAYDSALGEAMKVAESRKDTQAGQEIIYNNLLKQGATPDFALNAVKKYATETQPLQQRYTEQKQTKSINSFLENLDSTGDINAAKKAALQNSGLSGQQQLQLEGMFSKIAADRSQLTQRDKTIAAAWKTKALSENNRRFLKASQDISKAEMQYRTNVGIDKNASKFIENMESKGRNFSDALVDKLADIGNINEMFFAWGGKQGNTDAREAVEDAVNSYSERYNIPIDVAKQMVYTAAERVRKYTGVTGGATIDADSLPNEMAKLVQKYQDNQDLLLKINEAKTSLPLLKDEADQNVTMGLLQISDQLSQRHLRGQSTPKGSFGEVLKTMGMLYDKPSQKIEDAVKSVEVSDNKKSRRPKRTVRQGNTLTKQAVEASVREEEQDKAEWDLLKKSFPEVF